MASSKDYIFKGFGPFISFIGLGSDWAKPEPDPTHY